MHRASRGILANITLARPREPSSCARRTLTTAQTLSFAVLNWAGRVSQSPPSPYMHKSVAPQIIDGLSRLNLAPPRQKQSP